MDHRNNFDGLRLIAALMVVLSHMAALSGRSEWLAVGSKTYGALGVLIFFSISGYLVHESWARDPDLGRFLAKRFLRVAPGLLVAMPLTYLAVAALGLSGFPNNPWHYLNGSLWTIDFEVQCYLLLAALALSVRHYALVGTLLCVVAATQWPYSHLVGFAQFFAVGVLMSRYPLLRSSRGTVMLIAWGFALQAIPLIEHLALIVPAVSIWIGTRSWSVIRDAGRFGDLSYGTYIYAWPVQQVVVAYLPEASYFVLLAVTLIVLLPLALASWRLVEQPALSRKPTSLTPTPPLVHAPASGLPTKACRRSWLHPWSR